MAEYLQVRKNGRIKLPASILRKANLKECDLLEAIVEKDGSIHLLPNPKVGDVLLKKLIEKQQLQDVSWGMKQKRKRAGKK